MINRDMIKEKVVPEAVTGDIDRPNSVFVPSELWADFLSVLREYRIRISWDKADSGYIVHSNNTSVLYDVLWAINVFA